MNERVNLLEVRNLCKKFPVGERFFGAPRHWLHAVCDVEFDIPRKSVFGFVGESGSGKSTVMNLIARFWDPGAGRITIGGTDIRQVSPDSLMGQISMVFQDPEGQLFAPSVTDEVAFAPENLCFDAEMINARMRDALDAVGAARLGSLPPDRLSGGQQQLVALASVLALDPAIIILDEVAAQVDSEGVALLREAVKALKARGKTVLIIEHENDFESLYDVV